MKNYLKEFWRDFSSSPLLLAELPARALPKEPQQQKLPPWCKKPLLT